MDLLPWPARTATVAYERTVGRWIISSATRVIAVSDSVRDHLEALGTPPDRVTVVPNGVDLHRFDVERPASGSTVRIAYVGRLIQNKGPHLLLDALRMLSRENVDFCAVLAGDGPMRRGLEAQVRRDRLEGRVRFLGHVADVERVLADSDILVRPSLTEGMPLAVLEAMAAGLCVVAADNPGNAGVISHGRTGYLVRAGDAQRLAAQLGEVIRDGRARRRVGQEARSFVQRYTWDACARSTAEVLAQAARYPAAEVAGAESLVP